jgi:uncharacterized membrane protein
MSRQSKQLLILCPLLAVVALLLWSQYQRGQFNWWVVATMGALFIAKLVWAWRQQKLIDAKAAEQEPSN